MDGLTTLDGSKQRGYAEKCGGLSEIRNAEASCGIRYGAGGLWDVVFNATYRESSAEIRLHTKQYIEGLWKN